MQVKSNFGHAEGAAGLNSVIKAVVALENECIPPNIHFSVPNPHSKLVILPDHRKLLIKSYSIVPFKEADMHVPTELEPWPKDRPQRISINSFGIGGSNAHVSGY
jgi:acyl transferase domain-containing protein